MALVSALGRALTSDVQAMPYSADNGLFVLGDDEGQSDADGDDDEQIDRFFGSF